MNLKRFGALTLSAALTLSLLSGCKTEGGAGSSSGSGAVSCSTSSSGTEAPTMDLTGVTDPIQATAGVSGDTVIATVGDIKVSAAQWLQWVTAYVDQYAPYYTDGLPWKEDSGSGTLEDAMKQAALQMAQLYALMPGEAAKMGLTVTEDDLAESKANLTKMEEDLGGAEIADHYLWQIPMTREVYLEMRQSAIASDKIQEARYGENGTNRPTDAQVLEYAATELGVYRTKHILLKTVDTDKPLTDDSDRNTGLYEPLDDATVAEKKKLAEDILTQLDASSDPVGLFDELMNQYSEDEGLESNPDGYEATSGQMVEAYEQAAQKLKEGEYSGIVESQYGYHIILRLPLIADNYRSECAAYMMNQDNMKLLDANPAATTAEFDSIDLQEFYENLTALRNTVAKELAEVQSSK